MLAISQSTTIVGKSLGKNVEKLEIRMTLQVSIRLAQS